MTIYEHVAQVTTVSGSTSSVTLNVPGGILRYLLVQAQTSGTTIFRVNLTDANSTVRLNYAFVEGELVDDKIQFPVTGKYSINITNTSPDDTFKIIYSIQE